MYDLTALSKNIDRGSRRQQAVWEKIEALLSSKHQACISDLLRRVDPGEEHQSLDLTRLPIERLVQSMSPFSSTESLLMIHKGHSES